MEKLPNKIYDLSIRIPDGGINTKDDQGFNMIKPIKGFNCVYGYNDGILFFVNENEETFMTPFILDALDVLNDLGYTQAPLGVPEGTKIIEPRIKKLWEKMCEIANQETKQSEELALNAIINEIALQNGVEELPTFIKGLAIKIPVDGINIHNLGKNEKRLSLSKESFTSQANTWKIGSYYNFGDSSGMIRFIDRNGDYYLMPSDFSCELDKCGYKNHTNAEPDIDYKKHEFLSDDRILLDYYEIRQEMKLLEDGKISLDFIIALGEKKAEQKGITITDKLDETLKLNKQKKSCK